MGLRFLWWCPLLIALVLSGCDQNFYLVSGDSLKTPGVLTIHAIPPYDMTVFAHGEDFTGQWTSTIVDETDTLRKRYGFASKAYQRYVSGLGDHYLRHGHASLHGAKGNTMECDFDYRSQSNGTGACFDSNGEKYQMTL